MRKETKKFDDYEIPMTKFKFKANNEGFSSKEFSMQTQQIDYIDAETNTKRAGRTVKLQVEEDAIHQAVMAQLNDVKDEENKVEDFEMALFLKKVQPLINQSLDENIQYLEPASYGKQSHQGTCNEKSYVCAWNLSKRDFQPDKPTNSLETESSITSIEFHPTKPSWLVGGSFNGEIYLWDLSKDEDNMLAKSSIDDYFHRESISQFMWFDFKIQGTAQVQHNLLSISTDGKLLLWDMRYEENQKNILLQYPIKGFSLVRKKEGMVQNVGGLCMCQAIEDKNTFIVGSEAGSILRAVLTNINFDKKNKILIEQSQNAKWKQSTFPFMMNVFSKNLPDIKQHVENYVKRKNQNEIDINDIFNSKPEQRKLYTNPIQFAFEQHMGPVFSLDFSNFHRNLFLSGSLDGTVKVYDLLQARSLMNFEIFSSYVFKAQWSPVRPGVFATALSSGQVHLFDISQKKKDPIYTLEPEEQGISALNLKFNKRQQDLMAVAYSKCKIQIYQLTDDVCVPKKDEQALLHQIIEDLKAV